MINRTSFRVYTTQAHFRGRNALFPRRYSEASKPPYFEFVTPEYAVNII